MSFVFRSLLFLPFLIATGAVAPSSACDLPTGVNLTFPSAPMPDGGWPSLVLLSSASTDADVLDEMRVVSSAAGVALIMIDAPDADVVAKVRTLARDARIDQFKIFVGGFAEAGYRSLVLGHRYRELFNGVLSMSPEGDPRLPVMKGGPWIPQSLYVMAAGFEPAETLDVIDAAVESWRVDGQPIMVRNVVGGHAAFAEFAAEFGEALAWLQGDREGC